MSLEEIKALRALIWELAEKAVPSRSVKNNLYYRALVQHAALGKVQHEMEQGQEPEREDQ